MNKNRISIALLGSLLITSQSASAVIDDNASVVKVRTSCSVMDNCFESMPSLTQWMRQTRRPNESAPLFVDIGPGLFNGSNDININCDPANGYTGYATFQGSGMTQTTLQGQGSPQTSAVNINNCTHLNFNDLKITTSFYGGIYWNGGGESRWTNIEMDTMARGWAEISCGSEQGKHYWFGSKINVTGIFTIAEPYRATCDETWFFGSEVRNNAGAGNWTGGAVTATGNGIIHLYGSNLRSFFEGDNALPAASASNGGEIHIHGTGIDVISTTGKDIVALRADAGGHIHADVSAYVLKTSGNKTRIQNNGGMIMAGYQWAQSNQPPAVNSETGADIAVETNCDVSGCHDVDTGTETHLLILNNNCNVAGHGPWFDVVTGKCRGDMSM